MENFKMTSFEEMVADEMFPEVSNESAYDSENFLVKDRKHTSARRKKTYFKGKKRFDRLCDFAWEPLFVGGKLRKTNIVRPTLHRNSEIYHFNDRSTIRRLNAASDKMTEFGLENMEA